MPTVTVTDTPEEPDRDALSAALRAFNESKVDAPYDAQPLGIFIRDENGTVIGGLTAQNWAGWMGIEMLFVPEVLRGQGMGRDLMMRAEAIARQRGCVGIRLDTFSFQAPGFYKKLGFEEWGRQENWPGAETRYFMKKRL